MNLIPANREGNLYLENTISTANELWQRGFTKLHYEINWSTFSASIDVVVGYLHFHSLSIPE